MTLATICSKGDKYVVVDSLHVVASIVRKRELVVLLVLWLSVFCDPSQGSCHLVCGLLWYFLVMLTCCLIIKQAQLK